MTETGVGMKRKLGRSGLQVSAMGLGCWAIGGPFGYDDVALGWGSVDDKQTVRAIRAALDLGVTFFDTADVYGAGHSERILGKALGADRDQVVIATKFGHTFDESTRQTGEMNASPDYIRRACEASLRRLGTDVIDLYQLHVWSLPLVESEPAFATLEGLRSEGLIRAYAWSTDDLDCAVRHVTYPGFTALQHDLSVFHDAPELLSICDQHDLASINRGPLAMGFLTGKFTAESKIGPDDVRGSGVEWLAYFDNGRPRKEFLEMLDAIREVLTSGGRTLAQGALAWIWARSDRAIPIPGFKSVKQVEENAGAMRFGPLEPSQMSEIESLLGRC